MYVSGASMGVSVSSAINCSRRPVSADFVLFPDPRVARVLRVRAREIRDDPSYVYCAISSTLKYRKHCNYSNVVSSDALWKFEFYCVRVSKSSSMRGWTRRKGEPQGFAIEDRYRFCQRFATMRYFQMHSDTRRANVRKYQKYRVSRT